MNGHEWNSAPSLAARLLGRFGKDAPLEARYQLARAEERFRMALRKAGREIETIERWVAVCKLVDGESAPRHEVSGTAHGQRADETGAAELQTSASAGPAS